MPVADIVCNLRPGINNIQVGDPLILVITGNSPYGSTCLVLEGDVAFTRVIGSVVKEDLHDMLNTVPIVGGGGVHNRGGPRVSSARVPWLIDCLVSPDSDTYNGYSGPGDTFIARCFF